MVFITMGGTILTVILSVVYPAYKSMKALETKDTGDDDKVWLTYWCVFGIFTLIDEFGSFLLNMIPFYFYIKLCFFVWMMSSRTQGADIVYRKLLSPILLKHKDQIDAFIAEVKGSAMSAAKEGMK
jgi:receptor expression-enhancing protein 5/6